MWESEHFDLLEPEANLLQSKQREIRGQKQPEHKNYIEATHFRLHVKDEMEAMKFMKFMNLQRSQRRVWKKCTEDLQDGLLKMESRSMKSREAHLVPVRCRGAVGLGASPTHSGGRPH